MSLELTEKLKPLEKLRNDPYKGYCKLEYMACYQIILT